MLCFSPAGRCKIPNFNMTLRSAYSVCIQYMLHIVGLYPAAGFGTPCNPQHLKCALTCAGSLQHAVCYTAVRQLRFQTHLGYRQQLLKFVDDVEVPVTCRQSRISKNDFVSILIGLGTREQVTITPMKDLFASGKRNCLHICWTL